jgi:hypothetical protein
MNNRLTKPNTCMSAIWLRTIGNHVQVLVEMAGEWYVVIDDIADIRESTISHIVEAIGIDSAVTKQWERVKA